jgi:hypothetical protein
MGYLNPADYPLWIVSNGVIIFHDDFNTAVSGDLKYLPQICPDAIFIKGTSPIGGMGSRIDIYLPTVLHFLLSIRVRQTCAKWTV